MNDLRLAEQYRIIGERIRETTRRLFDLAYSLNRAADNLVGKIRVSQRAPAAGSQEQALLDAVDAARGAVQAGYEAQVWIKDRSALTRVF
jgi:hypothetical protein